MPFRSKRICLVQEVIRILRNTSRKLPIETRNMLLSRFSFRMMESGYSETMREEVITSGVSGYQKQVERDEAGQCPLYRPTGFQESERRKKKEINKVSWFRPHDTVLFCPPTPDSVLAKQMKKIAEQERKSNGLSVKVVERCGIKLQAQLPGLQEVTECQETDCFLHLTGGKGSHGSESVVYKGDCKSCLA